MSLIVPIHALLQDRTPPLDWRVRLKIGRNVAAALNFLHNRYRLPVIHRDVKSANVLLGKKFQAKLSDFGLAVVGDPEDKFVAHHGPSAGTRSYMAPEATEGFIVPAIDVYSLGMVGILSGSSSIYESSIYCWTFGQILYELATSLPPFSSKKKQTLVRKSNTISYVKEAWSKGTVSYSSPSYLYDPPDLRRPLFYDRFGLS